MTTTATTPDATPETTPAWPAEARAMAQRARRERPTFDELLDDLLSAWRRKQEAREDGASLPDLARAAAEFDDARDRMRAYHAARRSHPTAIDIPIRHAVGE